MEVEDQTNVNRGTIGWQSIEHNMVDLDSGERPDARAHLEPGPSCRLPLHQSREIIG